MSLKLSGWVCSQTERESVNKLEGRPTNREIDTDSRLKAPKTGRKCVGKDEEGGKYFWEVQRHF